MNVAVPASQHSPIFGQRALSQTVCNRSPRASRFNSMKFGPPGQGTFNHSGFGERSIRYQHRPFRWEKQRAEMLNDQFRDA
jgi:hypothetical protein